MIVNTSVSNALDKAKEDNQKMLVTQIYKYLNFKTKVAVQKLLEIDYVKNNLAKGTVAYYISSIRKYVTTGKKHDVASLPSYIYDIVDELKEKHFTMLTPSILDKYTERKNSAEAKEKVISSPVKVSKQSVNELERVKKGLYLESKSFDTDIEKLKEKIAEMQRRRDKVQDKINAINIVIGI